MVSWFVASAALIPLALWLLWLVFCTWITHIQPERSSKIIEAAGRWFPFRRSRSSKPEGGG